MKEWARISEIQDLIVNSGFHFAPHFAPRSKNPIPFELSSGSSPEILSKLPSADTMRQWLLSRSPKAESRTDSPKPPPVVRVLGKCRVCGKDVSSGAQTCPHCGEFSPAIARRCIHCGSKRVTALQRAGFGVGKAALEAAVLGPLGLLAGLISTKYMSFECIDCGKEFL